MIASAWPNSPAFWKAIITTTTATEDWAITVSTAPIRKPSRGWPRVSATADWNQS